MKKVIVFGAGEVGKKAKKEIERAGSQVICFLDNNEKRWGEILEGVPIYCPEHVNQLLFDEVAIGVYKAVDAITVQLVEYGVSRDRIIVPIKPDRIFPIDIINRDSSHGKKIILFFELGMGERKADICFNFETNFWGFIHFLKECETQGENVRKSYESEERLPMKLDNLCVNVRICNSTDVANQYANGQQGGEWMYLESRWIYQMLRSVESIRFWKTRYPFEFGKELSERLDEVKREMHKNNVPLEEVCVVGSTVLQLYGIISCKSRDDVDIIMTERLRDIYGKGLVIVSEHVEIHPQNEFDILDEDIIWDESHHFWFHGIKVLSIQDFYRNRKNKSSKDVKVVEYFLRS